jgi:hypothetical protein
MAMVAQKMLVKIASVVVNFGFVLLSSI